MTKPAPPVVKKTPEEVSKDKATAFAAELLEQELKKDPSALAELAKPQNLEQKADVAKLKKELDKTVPEQLWERNNPD